MQFSGKRFFEKKEEPGALPAGFEQDTAQDEALSAEGLDALRNAIMKKPALPGWFVSAGHFVKDNRKHFIVAASVLVIGAAVWLNWELYRPAEDGAIDAGGAAPVSAGDAAEDGGQKKLPDSGTVSKEELSADDYFAVSQINRQRARDEAIEVLQNVADGAENLADVREDALAGIAQIASDIEHEAAIESLVKGKGFEDCVAVISGDNANVIVKTAALLPNELAQIQEIVYETAGILPANVKIIEK